MHYSTIATAEFWCYLRPDVAYTNLNLLGLEYGTKTNIQLKIKEQFGRTVVFDVIKTDPTGINGVKYEWNFEGKRSTMLSTEYPIASYTYPYAGKYKVRVIATMEDGTRAVTFLDVEI